MVWVLRNKNLRTSSGPEGSSDKWNLLCAADKPSPMSCEATKGHFLFKDVDFFTAILWISFGSLLKQPRHSVPKAQLNDAICRVRMKKTVEDNPKKTGEKYVHSFIPLLSA
jgi:hypothetical protein